LWQVLIIRDKNLEFMGCAENKKQSYGEYGLKFTNMNNIFKMAGEI